MRIRVCTAAGCLSSGADDRAEAAGARPSSRPSLGETVQVCAVGCMRLCCEGPLVQVDPDGTVYERVSPDQAASIVSGTERRASRPPGGVIPERPFFARQKSIVLENCGVVEPERIESYIAAGGYRRSTMWCAR